MGLRWGGLIGIGMGFISHDADFLVAGSSYWQVACVSASGTNLNSLGSTTIGKAFPIEWTRAFVKALFGGETIQGEMQLDRLKG